MPASGNNDDLAVIIAAIRKYADERMSKFQRHFVTDAMINDLALSILISLSEAKK